jgi:putative transposase
MIKAHKIRLNPTAEQEVYFRKAAGTARFVFNWALAEWQRHKAEHPGEAHGALALKKDFNALKLEQFPWVYEVAKDVAEGAFTNLAVALKNYFESKRGQRKGPKVGFPKFKSKKNRRQSFRLNNDKIQVDGHNFYIPKLGWVNLAEAVRFEGKIMGAVVSRAGGRWYVSIAVEMEKPQPKEFAQPVVGVDVGIKTLAVLSDGTRYENQVLLRSELKHLKRLSRRLSRRQMGSRRWSQAKRQLECFHQRIANQRVDALHKMTTEIARTYAVIGVEDLNVAGTQHLRVWAGVLKNHRLALSLADPHRTPRWGRCASFGEIRRQLTYKSEWFGGQVVSLKPFFPSSQLCSTPDCDGRKTDLKLAEREWTCPVCGAVHDRDDNAARNIEREALRILKETPVVATSGSHVRRAARSAVQVRLVDGL